MTENEIIKWRKTLSNLYQCRICQKIGTREKFRAPLKTKKSNKEYWYCKNCANKKQREKFLIKSFGITIEEYEKLLVKQNHSCAICQVSYHNLKYNLAVDHDHVTNEIRGLLCNNCNCLIGLAKDCPDLLKRAIDYIDRTLG